MFILISGMTRSGKSAYAENILSGRNKLYIATARVYDDEMRSRVLLHQARRRDMGFTTIERTHDLAGVNIPDGVNILIEGLTTWTANEMFRLDGSIYADAGLKVYDDFKHIREKAGTIILVADDIFCDWRTYDDMTERYMKTLAELEIALARDADEVIECFAGLPLCYRKP